MTQCILVRYVLLPLCSFIQNDSSFTKYDIVIIVSNTISDGTSGNFFSFVLSFVWAIFVYIVTLPFLFCHDLRRYENEGISLITPYVPSRIVLLTMIYNT